MARASAIWFVTRPETGQVRACFTVKHELERFLSRRPDEDLAVWRIADGHHWPDAEPVRLVRSTLEPAWEEAPE